MIEMGPYWERVDAAAWKCLIRPGLDQSLMAYSSSVLLSDLRERMEDLRIKQVLVLAQKDADTGQELNEVVNG